MAVPAFKPVTVPSSEIVAIDVSSIDHSPVLSVASAGAIVATSLIVLPTSTLAVVGATVTPVTATVLGLGYSRILQQKYRHRLSHHQ